MNEANKEKKRKKGLRYALDRYLQAPYLPDSDIGGDLDILERCAVDLYEDEDCIEARQIKACVEKWFSVYKVLINGAKSELDDICRARIEEIRKEIEG